jgi:hypothetical protein
VASNPTSLTSQYYFIPCGFPEANWPMPEGGRRGIVFHLRALADRKPGGGDDRVV